MNFVLVLKRLGKMQRKVWDVAKVELLTISGVFYFLAYFLRELFAAEEMLSDYLKNSILKSVLSNGEEAMVKIFGVLV